MAHHDITSLGRGLLGVLSLEVGAAIVKADNVTAISNRNENDDMRIIVLTSYIYILCASNRP